MYLPILDLSLWVTVECKAAFIPASVVTKLLTCFKEHKAVIQELNLCLLKVSEGDI